MPAIGSAIHNWKQDRLTFGEGRIDGVEVWSVQFDDADDPRSRKFLAMTAPGIPRIYSSHPYHPWYYVQAISPRPIGPFFFEVSVHYGALTPKGGAAAGEPVDPVAIPPLWSYPQAVTTEKIDRDVDGDPITNSAGESPDPPLTEEFHDHVGRVVLYRMEYDQLQAWEYRGAVNSVAWRGFPAGTVLCTVNTGEEMQTPFGLRFRITMEFQARWTKKEDGSHIGWQRRVLDEGFRDITSLDADGKPEQFTDKNDVVLTEPTKLDGSGGKLADGLDPVWNYFDTKRPLPFAVLGLG